MTVSLDMMQYTLVLPELTRALYRYLTLDSKRIGESQQYCRRGIASILDATRKGRRGEVDTAGC